MGSYRLTFLVLPLMISLLPGCSGVPRSGSTLLDPLLVPTSEDARRLSMLADKLDRKALDCVEAGNCEQVYFARGLVNLFGKREAARASFRHVIEYNPASPLARSSQLWLRMMANDETEVGSLDVRSGPLTEIVTQFVREWIERELAERPHWEKPSVPIAVQGALVEQSRIVQGVQKQLRERERQIAVLRSQLEALKSIDQDPSYKQRKVKPPSSLRTVELYPE